MCKPCDTAASWVAFCLPRCTKFFAADLASCTNRCTATVLEKSVGEAVDVPVIIRICDTEPKGPLNVYVNPNSQSPLETGSKAHPFVNLESAVREVFNRPLATWHQNATIWLSPGKH